MSVQIFLSYARKDDLLPPHMSVGKGFVTCLREQLLYEFGQRGAPEPTIWRDTRSIERGDQFDPIIRDAIESSAILLVVLSPNWMSRPYCRQELELFKERWRHEDELGVRHRIVVACKSHVELERRPSLLQGQEGYDFFRLEGPERTGQQIDFFARGEIRDPQYHATIEELAGFLYRRAQHLTRHDEKAREDIDRREQDFVRGRNRVHQATPPTGGSGRKVYLAKPASDMRQAYSRLVEELSHNGYVVVPDPDKDIPHDRSATDFVDAALAEADVAVHLVGDGEGYAPEKSEPIVRLQLARAAARVAPSTKDQNGTNPGFRRIIWAPEAIESAAEPADADADAPVADAQPASPARLPDEVLSRFGKFEPGDKVVGGTLSKFVDFLIEHLRQSDTSSAALAEPAEDDWVYVYHVPEDTQYACDFIDALKERGVAANLPALEGDAAEVRRIHQQYLSECSAVVLCWAQATEAWAHAHAYELKDWKKLGRQKKFNYRGLLAGPPPGVRKTVFAKHPPANEIDVVVNLTEDTRPLVEAIEKFVKLAPAPAP